MYSLYLSQNMKISQLSTMHSSPLIPSQHPKQFIHDQYNQYNSTSLSITIRYRCKMMYAYVFVQHHKTCLVFHSTIIPQIIVLQSHLCQSYLLSCPQLMLCVQPDICNRVLSIGRSSILLENRQTGLQLWKRKNSNL